MSTRPCPFGTLTEAQCDRIPNASWDSNTGICVCCANDGSSYASNGVCLMCPLDAQCGDNGYCKGAPRDICEQDDLTFKWSYQCRGCSGTCDGDCGFFNEWFAFQDCVGTANKKCKATERQWKSWITYGFLLFLLILTVGIIVWFKRRKKSEPVVRRPVLRQPVRKYPCDYPPKTRISGQFTARQAPKKEIVSVPLTLPEIDNARAFSG